MILYKNGSAKLLNNKVVNNGSLCKFTLDCTNTIWGCEKTRVPGVPDCQEISREKTAIFVTVCKYKITKRKVIEAVVLKHLHDKMSCFVSKVCEQTLIHGQQRYFRDSYYRVSQKKRNTFEMVAKLSIYNFMKKFRYVWKAKGPTFHMIWKNWKKNHASMNSVHLS